ncbi:hypothetical protein Krac_2740 [Ktedonobacter racemifer DSM 44963]|uniref:Uncharacterized protein n=1 Tax=Ktedonobacter racemifer DSM 44963 TaxID=485913 RepID=D6TZI1_KTERA|nr:hypothetical protein Krac_2740 [Ktedonobacter racemifer DSM 44963]
MPQENRVGFFHKEYTLWRLNGILRFEPVVSDSDLFLYSGKPSKRNLDA